MPCDWAVNSIYNFSNLFYNNRERTAHGIFLEGEMLPSFNNKTKRLQWAFRNFGRVVAAEFKKSLLRWSINGKP